MRQQKKDKALHMFHHHHHHHHHHHRRGPIELLGRAAIGVAAAGTSLVVGAAAMTCAIVDDAINPRCRYTTTTQHLVVNVNAARPTMTMSVVVPPGFHSGMSMPVHAHDRIVQVIVPDYCAPGSVLYINA